MRATPPVTARFQALFTPLAGFFSALGVRAPGKSNVMAKLCNAWARGLTGIWARPITGNPQPPPVGFR